MIFTSIQRGLDLIPISCVYEILIHFTSYKAEHRIYYSDLFMVAPIFQVFTQLVLQHRLAPTTTHTAFRNHINYLTYIIMLPLNVPVFN